MPRHNRVYPKTLLVEGRDEKRVIPYLIEQNGFPWGNREEEWIVQIQEAEGISQLLAEGYIEAQLKASGREVTGIIVDADENAEQVWQEVRNHCLQSFPNIPERLPKEGMIVENSDAMRLGIWVMPDNESRGMLESFLMFLAPTNDALVQFARTSCQDAMRQGASFRQVRFDKASIHTWLAWQDPPGHQFYDAVKHRVLDSQSPHSRAFVEWFVKLFQL